MLKLKVEKKRKNVAAASGVRPCALSALLVHESPRGGDMAVDAGRLRDSLADDMDSGALLTVRVGRTIALSELQMSFAGRLPPGRCETTKK